MARSEPLVVAAHAGTLRLRGGAAGDREVTFADQAAATAWLRRFAASPGGVAAMRRAVQGRADDVRRLDDHEVMRLLAVALGRGVLRAVVAAPLTASHAPEHAAVEEHRAPTKSLTWVAIKLVDDASPPEPVPGERYIVTLSDGEKREGHLDRNGYALLDGIEPGSCKVTFPDLHRTDWRSI